MNNGVIRIARHGMVKFALGEGEPFELDVRAFYNELSQALECFWDKNRELIPDQRVAFYQSRRVFVQNKIVEAYAAKQYAGPPMLTEGEAETLIAHVWKEVDELKLFFVLDTPVPPSSPANTELRFAQ